jgi:uncharacterized protein (TIGR03437 family)
VKYWIIDITGKTMVSSVSTYEEGSTIDTTGWPDGGYQLNGCWVPPDATDCVGNANLMANTYFAVLRGVKDWWKNRIFAFGNGSTAGYDFWRFDGTKQLSLVKKDGDVTNAIQLPGLLVVELNSSRADAVVFDGTRSKTYSAAYRSPIYADTPSRFIPWTGNSDKLWAVANSADWANNYTSPGGIFTLWGSNFTANGPTSAPAYVFPLPISLDNIQVMIRANGIDYPAPLYYTSLTQINFLAPTELPTGTSEAQVRAVINGVATNPIHVVVRVAPSAFYADFASKQPAALFAVGPKTAQLVTEANPAKGGDWVQSYWNGLGPVEPPIRSGYAAGTNPVSAVVAPVTVTVGGKQADSWAGAAPGFAGLYQVNYQIPPGLPDGLADVVISVGGVTNTTPIKLAVAP